MLNKWETYEAEGTGSMQSGFIFKVGTYGAHVCGLGQCNAWVLVQD